MKIMARDLGTCYMGVFVLKRGMDRTTGGRFVTLGGGLIACISIARNGRLCIAVGLDLIVMVDGFVARLVCNMNALIATRLAIEVSSLFLNRIVPRAFVISRMLHVCFPLCS